MTVILIPDTDSVISRYDSMTAFAQQARDVTDSTRMNMIRSGGTRYNGLYRDFYPEFAVAVFTHDTYRLALNFCV